MIIDMSNVTTNVFLGEGRHLVKVEKIESYVDDYGNDGLKVTFKDKSGAVFNDFYPLTDKMKWKLALLAKAAGVWEDGQKKLNTDDLIGKYLYITIEEVNKEGKTYNQIKKWEYSDLNKKTVQTQPKPKPQQKEELQSIDINEDEIPF